MKTEPRYDRYAELSPCGLYRYTLRRRWADVGSLLFVMLNPSTADGEQDDPTVRRCVGFAKREGLGGIEIVNLFAFRTSFPSVLRAARNDRGEEYIIGSENDRAIDGAMHRASRIVLAWGGSVPPYSGGRAADVLDLLRKYPVWCLGTTKAGEPRHPVRLANDTPFTIYER